MKNLKTCCMLFAALAFVISTTTMGCSEDLAGIGDEAARSQNTALKKGGNNGGGQVYVTFDIAGDISESGATGLLKETASTIYIDNNGFNAASTNSFGLFTEVCSIKEARRNGPSDYLAAANAFLSFSDPANTRFYINAVKSGEPDSYNGVVQWIEQPGGHVEVALRTAGAHYPDLNTTVNIDTVTGAMEYTGGSVVVWNKVGKSNEHWAVVCPAGLATVVTVSYTIQ